MNDDDNAHDDARRADAPFTSTRHARSDVGARQATQLFERILHDVVAWFDDAENGPGTAGRRRTPVRRTRHEARPDDGTEGAADDTGHAEKPATAPGREAEGMDYDDEGGHPGGSMRGRGPKHYRRTDARQSERVSDALHDDAWLDAGGIEVSIADGEITLSGHVGSRRDKHRAENLAARAAGVDDVDNRLRVRRETSDATRQPSPGGLPG